MRALVDVVVVDQGGAVQQLHRGCQLRGAQRVVARSDRRRQLHEPGPQALAAGLEQAAHRGGDRLGVDHELAGELDLDQRFSGIAALPRELALELDRELAVTRSVELDREDRLPAPQDEMAVFDHQRGEGAEKQLPAVGMPVDRLVERDVEAACEVVVLVTGTRRRQALQQAFEVAQQQRLVLVDREAERGVQRLEVDAAVAQPRAAHLVPDAGGDVDELGGPGGRELEAVRAHAVAPRDSCSSCRAGAACTAEAAAEARDSIARAKATCTASGAWSASRREPLARHRSPISRVAGGAARPPRPCSLTPTSIRAAASASLGWVAGSKRRTESR